jgi:Ca-activated chloride channel family protein
MGAGHHVTAFYEIVPADAAHPRPHRPGGPPSTRSSAHFRRSGGDLVTVKIYCRLVRSKPSRVRRSSIARCCRATSDNTRFGVAVAQYALTLRGAPGFTKDRLAQVRSLAASAVAKELRGERQEFLALMDRATQLSQ